MSLLRAMLVTAGFGTRLAPLTDLLPKPAVPVGNRPAAFYALDHLARAGVRQVVLNTHHLPQALEDSVREAAPTELELRFVYEPEILGTGGGIKHAWTPRADETFVVMNGKLIFEPDLAAALAVHHARGAFATMIVKWVDDDDPTGVIEIDDAQRVRGVPGSKPTTLARTGLRRCMYTGVSLLSAAAHRELPERGCLIRQGYARWIERGAPVVAAYVENAEFRDIGMSLRHYMEANLALATGGIHWPGLCPVPGVGLCEPTAALGDATQLISCVVGAHARLAPGTHLERCVVWPGAEVAGTHRDVICLPDGRAIPVPPHH